MSPTHAPYPEELQSTLASASDVAKFKLQIPQSDVANENNITQVFAWPDGESVAIDFPAPAKPAAPIRQEYLEVYESLWTSGDPLTDFKSDLDADPVAGKQILEINGVVALGVEAHSPDAPDKINAAYLRFVQDGVEVQLSGGESLDLLVQIAEGMISAGAK